MALKDIFNQGYSAQKESECILYVGWESPSEYGLRTSSYYDFGQRQITAFAQGRVAGVTPFSQADREVLELMHAKLVALGGHPPELPPHVAVVQGPKKDPGGLNL